MVSCHFLLMTKHILTIPYCFYCFHFERTFVVPISFSKSCFCKSQITLILVVKIVCDASLTKHLLFSGQEFLTLQLHRTHLFLGVRICLLWLDIIDFIFLVQLQLIFIVFLLNIFDNEFILGKCFFSISKNNFSMFVFTLEEKGGLNHIIFLLLLLFSSFQVCSSLSLFLHFNS